MTRTYADTTELKVPVFVVRGLVAAAVPADEWREQTWQAVKWLASRPLYAENCLDRLDRQVLQAAYQHKRAADSPVGGT